MDLFVGCLSAEYSAVNYERERRENSNIADQIASCQLTISQTNLTKVTKIPNLGYSDAHTQYDVHLCSTVFTGRL